MTSGSIGSTRSGRYTLVPRMRASTSRRASGRHEMRDVGDVHAQPPAPVVRCGQRNGVVEVAGIDRVDGDDRLAGEIEAAPEMRLIELLGLLAGLFQHFVGKLVAETELVDDRQRVDARAPRLPEDLREDRFARSEVRRKSQHFDHDFVVGPGSLRSRIADQDGIAERAAVHLDVALSVAFEIGSHEMCWRHGPGLPRSAAALAGTAAGGW